ncbi:hypothetical protein BU24DRAFT_176734 [Aaosphaeria arxii CBS 175.79]|uniref:Histone-lysine N-methyltransferase SET9 n=1 Tax=Aaosphaeria arxii CBS 175.79 TaxID=1450172 RepID=A0A6A5XR22_9PLEO|nr:uncharacterized protein BU24DRAFT_176734 [Aaosphaeria arxii CBS 175.79]KAF2015383.1 hypothetical protein BU24DRAFT_176734 [Aaosphaeria arxii CBS 175.79]
MAPRAHDKKGGLTLEKLASYDDVITDALVDKIYYWATIRKNRGGRFAASRGFLEEDLADIIRKKVVIDKDPTAAVQHLLRLPGFRKFSNSLRDDKERDHFMRHLLRYVKIYMSDCPFEVTTTNRYTIFEHEASITARRVIKPREEIKYLTGVRVAMTQEEEKKIELARKDFSMVISSRKKTRSLFLGPARFANHDCDANARLSTTGHDGMQIVAIKHIDAGEEITVSYGEDYFGENNEECLCKSCEEREMNGWAPLKPLEEDDEEEGNTGKKGASSQPSNKRKHDSETLEGSQTPVSPLSVSPPSPKKVKLEEAGETPMRLDDISLHSHKRRIAQPLREATLKKAHSTSSLRQEEPISSIEDPSSYVSSAGCVFREIRTQQRDGCLVVSIEEMNASRSTTPPSSTAAGSPKSDQSTDATSVDEETAMPRKQEEKPHDIPQADDATIIPQENHTTETTEEKPTIDINPSIGVATVQVETNTVTTTLPAKTIAAISEDDSTSDLSELSPRFELDDSIRQVVKTKRHKPPPLPRRTRATSRYEEKIRVPTPIILNESLRYIRNHRIPGDYIKSDALLSAKYSKWVECHTCDDVFVQQDGYLTRKECPRCERHSKLYGFAWPKTDKDGKHDSEDRILDHRTVHRFVDPEEEKVVKKSKKSLKESIATRFSTPRSFRDSMSADADSGRSRRRVRETM